MEADTRTYRAQDKYAQQILDHLWKNAEELCDANAEGIFFRGSLHQLVRRVIPQAQAGDVVQILTSSGAITHPAQGLWQLQRPEVFYDEKGEPVDFDKPSFNRDTHRTITDRTIRDLAGRVDKLERQQATIIGILQGWSGQDVLGKLEEAEQHHEDELDAQDREEAG